MAAIDVGARPGDFQTEQYDQAEADFWRDLDVPGPQEPAYNSENVQPTNDIDEEIKVTKKRKPVAKLDADRLLSERGLPELRRRASKRVKLSGKGNEFEDIGKLLQMYQMWLDDMFPKAKFRDGLAMIEKVGHSKRLNVMRREWISATRPIVREAEPDSDHDFEPERRPAEHEDNNENGSRADDDLDALLDEPSRPAQPEDDDLDALLAQESSKTPPRPRSGPFQDGDNDDLDALLDAEPRSKDPAPDDFADDEEAMNEMGVW